jgi:hypothetical protein
MKEVNSPRWEFFAISLSLMSWSSVFPYARERSVTKRDMNLMKLKVVEKSNLKFKYTQKKVG